MVEYRFHFLIRLSFQVERGKQAHYCFDDAELRNLQSTFPANASYNIQRFKGTIINIYENSVSPEIGFKYEFCYPV